MNVNSDLCALWLKFIETRIAQSKVWVEGLDYSLVSRWSCRSSLRLLIITVAYIIRQTIQSTCVVTSDKCAQRPPRTARVEHFYQLIQLNFVSNIRIHSVLCGVCVNDTIFAKFSLIIQTLSTKWAILNFLYPLKTVLFKCRMPNILSC